MGPTDVSIFKCTQARFFPIKLGNFTCMGTKAVAQSLAASGLALSAALIKEVFGLG
jgi:hypothetical protein